jgi:hypothetical protein
MAKIKLGATVVGVRGTAGGMTFSANKSGNYVKSWARGSNPRAQRQTGARTALSTCATTWRTLTSVQRAAWIAWAALPAQARTDSLGATYYLSGFQQFVALSSGLLLAARAIIAAAPTLAKPVAPTISAMAITAFSGAASISYAAGTFTPLYDCVIELSLSPFAGTTVAPSKFIYVCTGQVPAGTSFVFTTQLAARLGKLTAGQKAYARSYRQNLQGYRSAPTALNCIIA